MKTLPHLIRQGCLFLLFVGSIIALTRCDVASGVESIHISTNIYVQAGTMDGGNGTKENPYNSLAVVESNSMPGDSIIVLFSEIGLDGGIALKDDQHLRGERGPNKELPKITNTTSEQKDGHVIILANNNKVYNLHVTGAYHTGIKGENVTGTIIENVLIQNIDQGLLGIGMHRTNPSKPSGIVLSYSVARSEGREYSTNIMNTTIKDSPRSGMLIHVAGDAKASTIIDKLYVDNITKGEHDDGAVTFLSTVNSTHTLLMTNSTIDNIGGSADGLSIAAFDASFTEAKLDRISILNTINTPAPLNIQPQGLFTGSSGTSRTAISMQNSEIVGMGSFGWQVVNLGPDPAPFDPLPGAVQDPFYIDLDLGGGPYGSEGNNRFIGNGTAVLRAYEATPGSIEGAYSDANIVAKNNW